MKAKEMSDAGVRNIVYATINSAVVDWRRAAVYLYKEIGVSPLKIDREFEIRFKCNKKVVSRIRKIKDAEIFFRGETYEFYSKTLDCYVEPERLLKELDKRALEDVLK